MTPKKKRRTDAPERLFKTTVVIWTTYDPTDKMEINDLAREAMYGDAYCSRMESEEIGDYETDEDWDGTDFFGVHEDDSNEGEEE